jgi:hypothetical protein
MLRAADRTFPAATSEIIHKSTNTTRYRNLMAPSLSKSQTPGPRDWFYGLLKT